MSNPTHPNTLAARTHLQHKEKRGLTRWSTVRAVEAYEANKHAEYRAPTQATNPLAEDALLGRGMRRNSNCGLEARSSIKHHHPTNGRKNNWPNLGTSPIIMTEVEPGKSDPFQEVSHRHLS